MILIQDLFLSDSDINYILEQWDRYDIEFSKYVINFYFVNFKKHNINLSPIKNGIFSNKSFEKIRLQKYNNTFEQVTDFHGHENFHNYILFLNNDFEGGELEFKNGVTVIPKKGSLVYFNNNEQHRVLPCIGDRWVFTMLGNEYIDLKIEYRTKSIL